MSGEAIVFFWYILVFLFLVALVTRYKK